jgi:hypothetical protein
MPLNPVMVGFQLLRHSISDAAVLKHEYGQDMCGYWTEAFRSKDIIRNLMASYSDLKDMPNDVKFDGPEGHLEKDMYTSFLVVCLRLSVVYSLQVGPFFL